MGGREEVVAGLVRIQELQAARMEESSRRLGRSITKQVGQRFIIDAERQVD